MPTITISSEHDEMLESLAELMGLRWPTRESVIAKVIEEKYGQVAHSNEPAEARLKASADELKFSRVDTIWIDDNLITVKNWNGLMKEMHVLALEHFGELDTLKATTSANIREGSFSKDGYRDTGGGFSIQHVDAVNAWKISVALSQKMNLRIKVEFHWLDKPGALHPGQQGTIEVG